MTGALILLQVLSAAEPGGGDDPRGAGIEGTDYARFSVSRLECVIGNNKSCGDHQAGYNGVFSLVSPDQPETAYVPLYAGVNLEHFFDRRPRSSDTAVFFEPRYAPMAFRRLSDTAAELHQPPTLTYQVESWTTFELAAPYYIDIRFRCIPRAPVFEGGFLGVFWASYMNAPLNKSIYFLGPGGTIQNPQWLQFCTQYHNHCSTVLHEADAGPKEFGDLPPVLWNQISPLRYSQPFYYGQIRNMVLIYVFEPNPYLRFAHSPSGGGPTSDGTDTHPAWDFQLVIPNYEVGKEYGFRMRLVYKPWAGRADVLEEVERFLKARSAP